MADPSAIKGPSGASRIRLTLDSARAGRRMPPRPGPCGLPAHLLPLCSAPSGEPGSPGSPGPGAFRIRLTLDAARAVRQMPLDRPLRCPGARSARTLRAVELGPRHSGAATTC